MDITSEDLKGLGFESDGPDWVFEEEGNEEREGIRITVDLQYDEMYVHEWRFNKSFSLPTIKLRELADVVKTLQFLELHETSNFL